MSKEEENKKRNLVIKYLTSTICQENLPCSFALTFSELSEYINELAQGEGEVPISHYEFVRDL
jgi:hypothetical protein